MSHVGKIKGPVMNELTELRKRIAKFEVSEARQKKTQEKFRQQNEFLTRMLESIPHPFYIVDVRDYTIKIANSATKFGKISKKSTCYALLHNRSMPCIDMEYTCPLKEVKKTKKPVITEHIHHDRRGNATNVEVHAYPILDEAGNVSEMIICTFDITKRKRSEEELQFSDAAFRSIQESIVATDTEYTIIHWNEVSERLYGIKAYEAIGKKLFDVIEIVETSPGETARRVKKLESHGYYHEEQLLHRTKNTEVWVAVSVQAIEHSGKRYGWVALAADITGRKQAEESLRQSEEKLRLMFESITEGITVTDLAGNITQVNDAAVRLHGYDKKQELIGLSALDLIAKKDHARAIENMNRVLDEGYVRDIEHTFLSKNGHEFHAELSAATIKDMFGKPQGFIAITKDITERKRAEAQLVAYQKKLRHLASRLSLSEERERRRIAMEVHDRISQNLAICLMKLGALRESAPSIRFAENIGELHALIKQLVEETRLLTSEISSPLLYEFGLEAAVEHLIKHMQERHVILFHFEDDAQSKPLDEDVGVLLFQTVRELLVNVAKHAQARNARVCMQKYEDNIRIIVEDDGIGFDTSEMTPDGKRTVKFGLFSIRERLHYIGGNIDIESEHSRGTRVTIVAPLKRQ